MKKNKIFIGLLVLCCICFSSKNAWTQLLVEEGKIKKVVIPGQTIAGTITLHNSTDKAIDTIIYLEDFEYVEPFDGSKKFYPSGTSDRSVSEWVSFQPKEVHLSAYAKKKINYTVAVPQDITGGFYGVLFFERTDRQRLTQGQFGLEIIARVGSLLFFETEDRIKKLVLQESQLNNGEFTAQLKNVGNVNLIAKCFYYIMDDDGIPVDRGESQTYYISEDGAAAFVINFETTLPVGNYSAILTFDLEDGVSSVHEFDFLVDAGSTFTMINE